MGMFSEIATEGTVQDMCRGIARALSETTDEGEQRGLKRAGRHALTLFEWTEPAWASQYKEMFADD